jgi:hypothetical protein
MDEIAAKNMDGMVVLGVLSVSRSYLVVLQAILGT